jgi:hypothetical protein
VTNLAVPVPRTFTVGEYETAAYFNANVRDGVNFLLQLPIATVFQTASQLLTAGTTGAPVAFDSTAVDSYGGHSNSTNNSRYTAQVAGWYLVGGSVPMNGTVSGTYRKCQIAVNGTVIAYATAQVPQVNSASNATAVAISPTIVFLNVGDYVQLIAISDASVTLTPNTSNEAYMTIVWVHN